MIMQPRSDKDMRWDVSKLPPARMQRRMKGVCACARASVCLCLCLSEERQQKGCLLHVKRADSHAADYIYIS